MHTSLDQSHDDPLQPTGTPDQRAWPITVEYLIEAAPMGIISIDMQGRFLNANRRFLEILGYSLDELSAKRFADLTHPEDLPQDLENLERMKRGDLRGFEREKRYIGKDGRAVWVNLSVTLVFDDAGAPYATISVVQDINARKMAELALIESELRFRTLFEQAPFSVQLLDPQGFTRQVNQAWRELWHIPPATVEQFILRDYNVLTDPQLAEAGITPYLRAAFEGRSSLVPPMLYDPEGIDINGRPRWVQAYIHPVLHAEGKLGEVMLIHHDISDQMEAQEQLRVAKEAAEEANELKSNFVANMSHEIRTPLGAIMGFAQLLDDNQLSHDDRREFIEVIQRNGVILTRLIDDILDLSLVESGTLMVYWQKISPLALVEEILALFRREAEGKGIKLTLMASPHAPRELQGDPIRFKQIITNLIGNAVKFTTQGRVQVTLQAGPAPYGLKLDVSDTGLGIAAEHHHKLFQAFSQIDHSHKRSYGGTGLGLALSRRLAHALGGELVLTSSTPNEGSVFSLLLPLEAPEARADTGRLPGEPVFDAGKRQTGPGLAGKSILVVDDSRDHRAIVELILRKRGGHVVTAADGQQALALAAAHAFDMILMDIQMPVMDGCAAARLLRQQGYAGPLIALTAHAMPEQVQACLAAGCDSYLSKPFLAGDLFAIIDRYSGSDI